MDWFGLFLRLDGRIGRRAFWLGFVVVVAALFVADLLVRALGVADAVAITLLVALGYPLVAILVKRLHDRGRSGWWAALLAAPLGAALVAALAARLAGLGQVAFERAATGGIWAGVVVVAAAMIVELGLRRGQPGYTEHGPPPLV